VFKLKKEPNSNIEPTDLAYGDDNGKQIISTFGQPNQWIDENNTIVHQNFSNLRDINSSINTQLLLNEYDGVADTEKLKLDGNDTYFGKVNSNGGSWLELVILKDRTDLRNAEINIYSEHTNVNWKAKFPNSEIFSQLRSGTIITISDTVDTDLSYDPFNEINPDWTINLKSSNLTLIEGNFVTDNDEIIVNINSAFGGVQILPNSGEGISGNGVDNKEVYKLKKDPYLDISPYDSAYGDDNQHRALSTFGSPNHWENNGNLITQNFINLRLIAMKHNFQEKDTSLILNEYNAVSSNQYLKDGGLDTHFGTIAGNGGSWLEMIVTKDFINLQNSILKIYKNNNLTFSGKIPELLTLAFLRKGTIITISNEPTDMSYSPFAPIINDWKLNINANELTNVVGTFSIDDNNNKISIVDSSGKEILANSGEGIWNSVIDNQEVYKLKAEPTIDTTPFDNYGDDSDTQAISTFGEANGWKDTNRTLHIQKLTIQKDKDLNETDGIVTVNIDGLNISDGESLQYVAPNNSLWITDDDSHQLFELDLSTKEVKSIFNDEDFGTFATDIEDSCHDGVGICDIESIAYDDNSDTLYVFSGYAHSTSAVFKLTRNSTDENFTISDYRKLGAHREYPGAVFANGEFLVSIHGDIYKYDFNANQIVGSSLYHIDDGGYILGLAYKNNTMYILNSKRKLLEVDWTTKELKNKYIMRDNGVCDPRGVEIINNKLYILEGVNTAGSDINAPQGHPLKNAIHIYQLYPEVESNNSIINVPNDYATIQEAVANAQDGATIVLAPATYQVNSRITIHQNNLKIVSKYYTTGDESYIASTIIQGDGNRDTHMFEGQRDNNNANSIQFIGLTVKDTGKFVTFVYGDNNLVDHCIIKDIGRDSISFDTYAVGTVTHCTIENS
ncbi:MAG: hypothetical protein KAU90_08030, partial [Sulfurovaceae bacterium]|nr:hypothetical protein [Sulfurovaceae bacterium]